MNINWQVRFKNPAFWTGLVGVVGTATIGIAQLLGIDLSQQVGGWSDALSTLVTAIFGVLALLGVTADPTTKGISDSTRAMLYTEPASTNGASKGKTSE